MRDKTGNRIVVGDLVLICNLGPYLNFAKVSEVLEVPRDGITVVEAYQPENDPNQEMLLRRRTVNSSHRVVTLDHSQVPLNIQTLLDIGLVITTSKTRMFDIPVVLELVA